MVIIIGDVDQTAQTKENQAGQSEKYPRLQACIFMVLPEVKLESWYYFYKILYSDGDRV